MHARVNVPDLAFAAFLVALGAFAFALASELSVGTAAAMGPGYVPRALAILIMIYGAVLGARAVLAAREAFPAIALRPLLMICAAVALFALLLPIAGLALTSFAVVACAGLGRGTTYGCARTSSWRWRWPRSPWCCSSPRSGCRSRSGRARASAWTCSPISPPASRPR